MWRMQVFECKDCKTEQEQLISNKDLKAEDKCKNCNSDPKRLKPKIGVGTHSKHVSWSKWKV